MDGLQLKYGLPCNDLKKNGEYRQDSGAKCVFSENEVQTWRKGAGCTS